MSKVMSSVGLVLPLDISEKWSPQSRSSRVSSSRLLILATVTTAILPKWELTMMGCGSVSEMMPMPLLPSKRSSSFSKRERK